MSSVGATWALEHGCSSAVIFYISLFINTTVSTCIPKYHRTPDSYINITVAFGNGDGMIPLDNLGAFSNRLRLTNISSKAEVYKPKPKTTYNMIKDYVLNKYSFNVSVN
jgi:hypothetical protein